MFRGHPYDILRRSRMLASYDYFKRYIDIVRDFWQNDRFFKPQAHLVVSKLADLDVKRIYRLFRSMDFEFERVEELGVVKYKGLKKIVDKVRLANSLHANGVIFKLALHGMQFTYNSTLDGNSDIAIPLHETDQTRALFYSNCSVCSLTVLCPENVVTDSEEEPGYIDYN